MCLYDFDLYGHYIHSGQRACPTITISVTDRVNGSLCVNVLLVLPSVLGAWSMLWLPFECNYFFTTCY